MDTAQIPSGTIVVGVDGSTHSEQALQWAAEQASLEHRGLTLVHAVGTGNAVWVNQPGIDQGVIVEAMRTEGRAILDQARGQVAEKHPDLEVREVLRRADARVALMDLSKEAAMLVLGSRGRGPVKSLVLGSVSLAISRHASCPVVIIRPHNLGTVRNGVLVGVDGTDRCQATVEFAFQQAAYRHLPLTAMHCFWDVLSATSGSREVSDEELGLDVQRMLLSEAVAGMREKYPDVNVHLTLSRGLADDCLIRAARKMDMVVVGTHPTRSLLGFFDPEVDRSVVEHAACIVAVVPERQPEG